MNTYVENINDIIHETSVDFVLRPCAREIHIVQYDKSLPIIKVNLLREGQPYQLPSNAAVHVRLGKLDHTFVYANILGMNEDRTIAYFEVTEQMAMIAGRISPVIEVVYQGKVACSSPIPFVIDKNPVQEGQIESHDEFPVIYQLESDVEEHNDWIRRYTALTEFDGFVEGESVWDDIVEGETKYCQSGSQTEDVPGENTVIKIDLSQQHLSKSESKALYIKKIIINYTPDGQEEEETYEYTFNSRIFGTGSSSPTIEPLYADLIDENSGVTLRWYLNYLLQEGVSNYFGNYNGTKGQQFGSNNNPPALISLSTSSLENCTVNSIYVEVSSNSGTQAKCKLTIVDDIWTCNDIPDPQISSDNEGYDWLHEPNGTHLGSSSGGQVIHHYNHVFLKKENGAISEVQPDPALQYVLNDYSATYKYSIADNLLHQIGSGGGANFEVLSRIEQSYDSEDGITYITFPANIMPEVMFMDSTNLYIFFDYKNHRVLDSSGNEITVEGEFSLNNNVLSIQLDGDYSIDPEYDFIKYGVFDGADNPGRHTNIMLNYYEVYNAGSGLPEATKTGQVLVSNSELEFEVQDSVPKAENLTSVPDTNDTMYSSGPTGGLTDITTGEESYLINVKGYTINWGWYDTSAGQKQVHLDSSHIYIWFNRISVSGGNNSTRNGTILRNTSSTYLNNFILLDLTLMFGGNDRIPFSLDTVQEYPANGNLEPQYVGAFDRLSRFFAGINLYDLSNYSSTSSFKNVKATKIVETGRNLWDESMETDGLQLLAGYRYEIYLSTNGSSYISVKADYQSSYSNYNITSAVRGDGYRVFYIYPKTNIRIKSVSSSYKIVYVGFVHSGNYCLTTGSTSSQNYPTTTKTIPQYVKYEYPQNESLGINGLNGIPDNSETGCSVYDTIDMIRVGSVDLSTLPVSTTSGGSVTTHYINLQDIPNIDKTSNNFLCEDIPAGIVISEPYLILTFNGSDHVLSGNMLYKLETPISTGNNPFEAIQIEVNDMGSEYFLGTDVCPVNQTSIYIKNLKDKLVNLETPIIEAVSYNSAASVLEGLNINGNYYRLTQLGNATGSGSIAIGSGSNAGSNSYNTLYGNLTYSSGSYNTIIGYNASSNAGQCVVIGRGSSASTSSASGSIVIGCDGGNISYATVAAGMYAVVIGYQARQLGSAQYTITLGGASRNLIEKTLCIDGNSVSTQRTYQVYSPNNIWFRNEVVNDNTFAANNFEYYKLSHFLSEYICNNELTLQDNKYYVSYTDASNYKTFTSNVISGTATDITSTITGVHITVILTDNDTTPTWHSVVGLDLMLYDTVNSIEYQSYGRVDCDGTAKDISAYIDSDGCVVVVPPSGTVIASVKYNIK